ncbi:MAG: HAMP domain-containing protein [Deltaproteobacteria bacterium]|nr:HAMP domain-containing protein [Deltaproteobacteria bacterium]MBW2354259.1 HAMP domain-containing protein [Deltaproteobacteria bacterium]
MPENSTAITGDKSRVPSKPMRPSGQGDEPRIRLRIPIFVKLATLSALLILLVISTITYLILEKQKEQFTENLMNLGINMARIAANNSADKLLAEEELDLFRLVKDISENEHVLKAFIVDRQNMIKAHSDIEEANKAYAPPRDLAPIKDGNRLKIGRFLKDGEEIFLFERSITYQGLPVGGAFLMISPKNILKNINSAKAHVLVVTLVIVMTGILLSVVLGIYFSRPIKKLQESSRALGRGDFDQRVQVRRNDELGDLALAFNEMAAGLSERERIREAFGKYVTPEIRDEILSGRIPLDGERRMATVLFSDLRDFTPYVEEHAPEEAIKGLRAYFTAMQRAIDQNGGLVLQYVGDEIETVFAVPVWYEDHAERAIRAALDMRAGLEELNRKRTLQGLVPFRHGIGIHTGEVLAGNTGSEDRLSYTLIGNTVNLTSRIEGLTKVFNCDILASEETVRHLTGSFKLKKEPPQMVKGYSRPITVYRVTE